MNEFLFNLWMYISSFWIELILVGLSGVLFAEMQTIWHNQVNKNWPRKTWFHFLKDNPKWKWLYDWWTNNNWDNRDKGKIMDWLLRVPLSFLKDGLHFTFSLGIVLLLTPFVYHVSPEVPFLIKEALLFAIVGIGFNFSYHY